MSSSSDSDAEDPAELQRIKDAVFDVTLIHSSESSTISKQTNSDLKVKCHHYQHNNHKAENSEKWFDNELGISEEYRQHVARKLADSIDSQIVFKTRSKPIEEPSVKTVSDGTPASGFKLFSTSVADWSLPAKQKVTVRRRRPSSNSSASDNELDRCASIAVSAGFIYAQSQPLQAPIYQTTNSVTHQVAKKKKKKKKLKLKLKPTHAAETESSISDLCVLGRKSKHK